MAPQATSRRIQKMSLVAAVIAVFNKVSLNNVLASAAIALVAPTAATAFVYEVSTLRDAQLNHEATDRIDFLRVATEPAPALADSAIATDVVAQPRPDIGLKLDGMIASRAKMLDIFGDDPSTVAPIYARIIKQMLSDDNATFASLSERRENAEAETLTAKAERLRAVHARLAHLLGV